MTYAVTMGKLFAKEFANFPSKDQDRILDFISHYQSYGFDGLPGKNVPSWRVPPEDPEYDEKVNYARFHQLWHYHIGIPDYELSECGSYRTSEYLLHYRRNSDVEIKLVDLGYHPPFRMPSTEYMK
jgi:hypothetical protein